MTGQEILLTQRLEMAEKFAAEAQNLIRAGKNAGAVLRKLQAVRNICTGRELEAERAEDAVANAPVTKIVCDVCNDTHSMELADRMVMCTFCPSPCQKCRQGGIGPYCTSTPCECACHEAP
jgi:hypothetical protein